MSAEEQSVTVRTGHWLYAGQAQRPVAIVGLPYDYHYEVAKADGQLEPGEQPTAPDDAGLLYYGYFFGVSTVDTAGYRSPDEAMAAVQRKLPSPVVWDEHARRRLSSPHIANS